MAHDDFIKRIQDLQQDLDEAPQNPAPDAQTFLDAAHLLALSMNLYYAALLKQQHTSLLQRAETAEVELGRLKAAIHAAMGIPIEHLQTVALPVEKPIIKEEPLEEPIEEEIKLPEEVQKRWGTKEYAVHAYLLLNKYEVTLKELVAKMQEQGWQSTSSQPQYSAHTVLRRANSPLTRLSNGNWTLKREGDREIKHNEEEQQEEQEEQEEPEEQQEERPQRTTKGTFSTASIKPNAIREGPLAGLSATSKIECALCGRKEWVHKASREGWPAPDRCPGHTSPPTPTPSWLSTVQLPISEDARRAEAERQEEKLDQEDEPDLPNPFSRKRPTARGNAQGWREKRQQQYRHKNPWKKSV